MDLEIKKSFLEKWGKYFPGSELPIACYFADEMGDAEFANAPRPNKSGYTCIYAQLAPVRNGRTRAFNAKNLGCFGARATLGFEKNEISDEIIDFLVNVERYKKSPEHVRRMFELSSPRQASGEYILFKRWDMLGERDDPQVVFFLDNADTIAGLHALANFDTMTPHGVVAPFGSGCDSLLLYAFRELDSKEPKAVLSAMDPSMRNCVKPHLLGFSASWPKFMSMLENMDDSFLATESWKRIKARVIPTQLSN